MQAQEGLRLAGVCAANEGGITLTKEAAEVYHASAGHRDQSVTELGQLRIEAIPFPPRGALAAVPARVPRRHVSRIFKHLDAIEAAKTWHAAGQELREVMLSRGGRGRRSLGGDAVQECGLLRQCALLVRHAVEVGGGEATRESAVQAHGARAEE